MPDTISGCRRECEVDSDCGPGNVCDQYRYLGLILINFKMEASDKNEFEGVCQDLIPVTPLLVVPTLNAMRTDKVTLCALVCQDTSLNLTPSQVTQPLI